jgi:hypothetical protein
MSAQIFYAVAILPLMRYLFILAHALAFEIIAPGFYLQSFFSPCIFITAQQLDKKP